MPIYVGCTDMPVARAKYKKALSALELTFSQSVPPKVETAKRWKEEAGEGFVHSIVAPSLLSRRMEKLPPGLPGDPSAYGGLQTTEENLALFSRTREATEALEAKAIVFATPSQIAPGPRGRKVLQEFFAAIGAPPAGVCYAWEPHGPWDGEQIAELAGDLGLVPCVDPLRDTVPEGDVAYARLGPFAAMGRSLADDELEEIADSLAPYGGAFCFFATDRSFDDARRLRAICES